MNLVHTYASVANLSSEMNSARVDSVEGGKSAHLRGCSFLYLLNRQSIVGGGSNAGNYVSSSALSVSSQYAGMPSGWVFVVVLLTRFDCFRNRAYSVVIVRISKFSW